MSETTPSNSPPPTSPAPPPSADPAGAGGGEQRFPLPGDVLDRPVHDRTQGDQWRRSLTVLEQWSAAWDQARAKLAAPPVGGRLPEEVLDVWRLRWARNTLICLRPQSTEDVAALCELGRVVDDWFRVRTGPVYRDVEFTLYNGRLSAPGQGQEPVPRVTPSDAFIQRLQPATRPGQTDAERSQPDRFGYEELLRRVGFLLTDAPLTPGQDDFLRRLGYDLPEWCRDEPPEDTRLYVTSRITERCQEAVRRLSRAAGLGPRTLPADRPFAEVLDEVERWLVEAREAGETDPDAPTATVGAALAVIRSGGGRGFSAKEILNELQRRQITIERPTFYRHVAPALKKRGVRNDRSRGGYYLDPGG